MSASFEPGLEMEIDLEETIEARRTAALSKGKLAMARIAQQQNYLAFSTSVATNGIGGSLPSGSTPAGVTGSTSSRTRVLNEPNNFVIDLDGNIVHAPSGADILSNDEDDDGSKYAEKCYTYSSVD